MAYPSYTAFLKALEDAGELRRINEPVATELQITEIADREMKSPGGGKALLFEKPTINGRVSEFPVAINALGSKRRMAMALGLDSVDELASQLEFLMKAKPPKSFKDALKLLRNGIDLIHARPRTVKNAACQEEVRRMDEGEVFLLDHLPILKCWPQDGGLSLIHI